MATALNPHRAVRRSARLDRAQIALAKRFARLRRPGDPARIDGYMLLPLSERPMLNS
jgi:hypothetical protein